MQAFVATNTVSATIKDVAKAGALIDAAVNAGANQVYGPSLSAATRPSSTATPSRPRSQTPAPARRRSPAASNLSLGRITAIVEGGGSSPQPFAAAEKAMDAGSTPIEPGTQQVTAVVSVTFSVS